MKSEKKEVRMFVCEFCGKEYLSKKEAEYCEKECSAQKQKAEDHTRWLETHKPKFKVGDIVKFNSPWCMDSYDACNLYFAVDRISSEYYDGNTWSYYGEIGYSYGGEHDPTVKGWVSEDSLESVLKYEDYKLYESFLKDSIHIKHRSQIRFDRNRNGFLIFVPTDEACK